MRQQKDKKTKQYYGHSIAYSARTIIQPTNSNSETYLFITAVQKLNKKIKNLNSNMCNRIIAADEYIICNIYPQTLLVIFPIRYKFTVISSIPMYWCFY